MGYGETRVQPFEPKPREEIKGTAPYNSPKEEEIQVCYQLKKP
jgi:hypothetical protein